MKHNGPRPLHTAAISAIKFRKEEFFWGYFFWCTGRSDTVWINLKITINNTNNEIINTYISSGNTLLDRVDVITLQKFF